MESGILLSDVESAEQYRH